ncbi:hypothetical protein Taro_035970 [Colocasia esculenta]|uniref:Fungal lipase-type domain-containing protein n=1 Tax=Colocasia esculenta TaxID=4460 RepID=A0A843WGE2_COLES|nr:hypothetical protein [Colocasia esculenta]
MEGLPAEFLNVPYLTKPSSEGAGGSVRPTSVNDKEDISDKWRQLQGADDWVGLLEPFDSLLRAEIRRYGGFAQATYDAFDFDPFSKYAGSARYGESSLLEKVGLGDSGYDVTRYIYATMPLLPDQPRLLRHWLPSVASNPARWLTPKSLRADSWIQDSNWMGFQQRGDPASRPEGYPRGVAWRGTVEPSEWFNNVKWQLEPLGSSGNATNVNDGAKVERGFQSIYTAKSGSSTFSKTSASEQVMAEVRRLVDKYHGGERKEVVNLTITGHSLGGAIALLNAHEAGAAAVPGLTHVSVVSFGAPKVGNAAFAAAIAKAGVKVLRVDLVPQVPGLILFPGYEHAGIEKDLDIRSDPDLKYSWLDFPRFHSLKTYLRLVERQLSTRIALSAARVRLVEDMPSEDLDEVLRTRECWYRMVDMGLLQGPPGWVRPERKPEDMPSPPDGGDVWKWKFLKD